MRLVLAFHHHQPLGQLPWIVTDAVRDCYDPLLKVLLRHPHIHVALHYSGPLLEMLAAQHPHILAQVKVLLERGQAELMGGARWEAILPIWPPHDQHAQLQSGREQLKVLLDAIPNGMWLPERVWEPALTGVLPQAGYCWSMLDDNGLLSASARRGWHRTGELTLFSIDAPLRRLVPWRPIEEIIAYLRNLHQRDAETIAVFADDAEKFGSWPGTFQLIYEEGYLDHLFAALEQNADWLQTALPSACLPVSAEQLAKVEIPPTTYPEMLEWSGGNWRHFLERYPESRDMQQAVLDAPQSTARLAAQCNDAYWHGVFGGLYLPHLRQAVYGAAAGAYATSPEVRIETRSSGEVMLRNTSQILGIRPKGGQIFQLLDLQKRHNWSATLRRYQEKYAESEAADWYGRGCAIDHFLGAGATPESIVNGNFPEEGDFVSEDWHIETRQDEEALIAILTRQGGVWQHGQFAPLEMKKIITLPVQGSHWKIQYELFNPGEQIFDLWWANEWNLTPSGSDFPARNMAVNTEEFTLEETRVWEHVSDWQVNDNWLKSTFMLSADANFDLWQMPFRTMSRHEGESAESIFQQVTVVMCQKVLLEPGQKYFCELNANIL